MQATTVHPSEIHTQNFHAVAEKINAIGSNTYVQWGTMIAIITLVAWFVAFKTSAENAISRLSDENQTLRVELKEMKAALPSKDWLELKFQNLQDQMIISKNARK